LDGISGSDLEHIRPKTFEVFSFRHLVVWGKTLMVPPGASSEEQCLL
jgi:hypothetical protein